LPPAGSGASLFRGWDKQLPGWIHALGVALPGHEYRNNEPLPRSLADVVTDLETALMPLLDRPFALFGHSLGG
jgi:surfactin synthase thioesterase subunit